MTAFEGFGPEALRFLEELEENNDRDWFKAHRARYDAHLVAPARALAREVARTAGPPKLFRPFRDTRFHPGPPIKEHIGLALGIEGAIGSYVELSLDGLLVAAGMYAPQPDQVARLREAVADDRRAAPLVRAIARARRAELDLGEPDLKRAPRGFDADHPRAELLRHKRLVVSRRHELGPWVHDGEAALERIHAQLKAVKPLVTWLREHVGPSQRERPRR